MLLTNQGTSRTILSNYQVAMQTMSYTQSPPKEQTDLP